MMSTLMFLSMSILRPQGKTWPLWKCPSLWLSNRCARSLQCGGYTTTDMLSASLLSVTIYLFPGAPPCLNKLKPASDGVALQAPFGRRIADYECSRTSPHEGLPTRRPPCPARDSADTRPPG